MSEFQPTPINLQGKQYLEVAQRVFWLREQHPDAQIITDVVEHDPEAGRALVRAVITIPSTGGVATGYGTAARVLLKGPVAAAYLEKAETRAIGRACAGLGYGTLAALTEDADGPADAPVDRKPAARPATPPPAAPFVVGRDFAPAPAPADDPLLAARAAFQHVAELAGFGTKEARLQELQRQFPGITKLGDLTLAQWQQAAATCQAMYSDAPLFDEVAP